MKCNAVTCVALLWIIFVYFQTIDSFVLKNLKTAHTSESVKLDYVDNLLNELFDTVTQKKLELEDDQLWPRDYANDFLQQSSIIFDYIVVGAGTAGSVIASRLSEDPHVNVLVLEAGGNPPIFSEIHTLSLYLLNTSYTWSDYAEPNPTCCQAMKDSRCYWPRGRMIGGTGGINGNIFLTGLANDFDEWQQQGNDGWSWNHIYPFYEKATHHELSNDSRPLGALTLNYFQRLENYHILTDLMINGTNEAENLVPNKSLGYMENITATVDRGKRMSTGKTYLGKVYQSRRHNLFVMKYCVATKILFHNGWKATGVEFLLNGTLQLRARARREVIISAGTFNSPKLLMLSGIGPAEHLSRFNISLVKSLPVGQNLQDHGMMTLVLKFTKNIPNILDESSPVALFDYLINQKGPLASNPTLVGFINTLVEAQKNKSDVMIVSHISKPTNGSNVFEFLQFKEALVKKFLNQLENQTILEIQGLIIKPKSRGSVQLKSLDPLQGPLIHNNYASAPADKETLLRFIRFIQKLVKTPTFQYYGLELITIPLEECDAHSFDSNDYWLCYIKYFYISAWHAAGTCRMGPSNDPLAVLDNRLRVHGIKGLRVIDASIMPNITSSNTNGPTIMIAERGAQLVKDDWLNSIS